MGKKKGIEYKYRGKPLTEERVRESLKAIKEGKIEPSKPITISSSCGEFEIDRLNRRAERIFRSK